MALWTGQNPYATKKQLISSISGLYTDIQDLEVSSITVADLSVSTLTAKQWISTPELYVSSIVGGGLQVQNGLLQISTGDISLLSLSTLSFKGVDIGGVDLSFDLGLGNAVGGALAGLGAAVGGVFVGAGVGISGLVTGLFSLGNSRGDGSINNNIFETINGTTQFQISTLGDSVPLQLAYSTIFRTVSSVSANQVPGREIFTSTLFFAGTTCIRSVSDPLNIITGNPDLNTSTIQSFGQWVPLPFQGDNGVFSTIRIEGSNIGSGAPPLFIQSIGNAFGSPQIQIDTQPDPVTAFFPQPINPLDIAFSSSNISYLQETQFQNTLTFVSTTYTPPLVSTITNDSSINFINSAYPNFSQITYDPPFPGSFIGDFAICDVGEVNFRSTGTIDFITTSTLCLVQWGTLFDNRNSTVTSNSAKRVSWDNVAGTSNFIDIPQPASTVTTGGSIGFAMIAKPNEVVFAVRDGTSGVPNPLVFNINSATFGSETTFSNQPNFPYQFNGNTFINGILEAQTIIALSSIFATSTFVDAQISTASIVADVAILTELYGKEGYFSTLKSSSNFTNDYITTLSRVRMAGFQTPLSIVTGKGTNFYDTSARFDFVTDTSPQAIYLESQPNNNTLMSIFSTNIEIPNLVVENLTASNLIYGKAEAPNIETSTIVFGWTGSFDIPTIPKFSLSQSLTTAPGLVYNTYAAASNQALNIMGFSNTVNMLAQQFSTPLTYLNTTFDATNIQGWASTIFFNAQSTTCRVNLASNSGKGELSLQGQTHPVAVSLNTFGDVGGIAIPVPVGSTYKFTSDGTTWATLSNAPTPGTIQYNNALQITMDFENTNISTTDTLNINAEKINLNGIVNIPQSQFSNIFVNGLVSSVSARVDAQTGNGFIAQTTYTGSFSSQPAITPLNLSYTANTTDFLTTRDLLLPSRGFNLFNSFNLQEWNNTVYNLDTTPAAGRPVIIVGEVLEVSPTRIPYSGQFWINNSIDAVPLVTTIYQNIEGVLTSIGVAGASGTEYTRVSTSNGTTWVIQNNVPSPQGTTPATYNNFYQVQMNNRVTTVNSGMPMVYNMPNLVYNTNKTFFFSPMIRVATIDADSFNTREAGMENVSYFDGSVVFSGGPEVWQSDALNPIINYTNTSYYSVAGWEAMISISRIRTDNDIPISWEVSPVAFPVGGGATDFIWGSSRYLQVRTIGSPSASLTERYLMIPKNYFNFNWQGQGPI